MVARRGCDDIAMGEIAMAGGFGVNAAGRLRMEFGRAGESLRASISLTL